MTSSSCPKNTWRWICSNGSFHGCCSVNPCDRGYCRDEQSSTSEAKSESLTTSAPPTSTTSPALAKSVSSVASTSSQELPASVLSTSSTSQELPTSVPTVASTSQESPTSVTSESTTSEATTQHTLPSTSTNSPSPSPSSSSSLSSMTITTSLHSTSTTTTETLPTSTPTSIASPTSTTTASPTRHNRFLVGGLAAGGVGLLLVLALLGWLFYRRRRKSDKGFALLRWRGPSHEGHRRLPTESRDPSPPRRARPGPRPGPGPGLFQRRLPILARQIISVQDAAKLEHVVTSRHTEGSKPSPSGSISPPSTYAASGSPHSLGNPSVPISAVTTTTTTNPSPNTNPGAQPHRASPVPNPVAVIGPPDLPANRNMPSPSTAHLVPNPLAPRAATVTTNTTTTTPTNTNTTSELPDTGFYRPRAELAANSSRELINIPQRLRPRNSMRSVWSSRSRSRDPAVPLAGPIVTADGVVLTANMERFAEEYEMPALYGGLAENRGHVRSFVDCDAAASGGTWPGPRTGGRWSGDGMGGRGFERGTGTV